MKEVIRKTHLEVTLNKSNLIISQDAILFIFLVSNSFLINGGSTILEDEWTDLGELINCD